MPLLLSNYLVLSEEWAIHHCILGESNTFSHTLDAKKKKNISYSSNEHNVVANPYLFSVCLEQLI